MLIPSTHGSFLVELQRDGRQEDAWAAFLARYRDVILGWCRQRALPQDCAEDLTQEVSLKLFKELPAYDPARGRFRSWLKSVVNNTLTDYWRRQCRRPEQGVVVGTAFLERLAGDKPSGVIEARAKALAAEVLARVASACDGQGVGTIVDDEPRISDVSKRGERTRHRDGPHRWALRHHRQRQGRVQGDGAEVNQARPQRKQSGPGGISSTRPASVSLTPGTGRSAGGSSVVARRQGRRGANPGTAP
jgi:RNA polymerase sigma factor (sigma-70 family)